VFSSSANPSNTILHVHVTPTAFPSFIFQFHEAICMRWVLTDPVWQSWSLSACWSRCYLCTKGFLWSCEGRDGGRSSTESWALTTSKSPQYHWPSTLSLPFSSSPYDNFLFLQERIKAIAFLGCKWLWEPSYICRTWPVGECSSIFRAMHPMLVHP
jgi:hypothetical protein